MAVAFGAIGAKSAGGTSTISVAHPTSVGAGDLLVAGRVGWLDTISFTDEAGWTLGAQLPGGTGTSADAHTTEARIDTREAAGGETGSVTFDQGGTISGALGIMARYTKAADKAWGLSSTSGTDNAHGADRSVTGSGTLDLAPGDVLVAVVAVDTDAALTITSPAFTASGITFGTTNRRTSGAGVITGVDGNIELFDATVTAGTGAVAPTLAFTTATSQCGPVVFLRLREVDPPPNPRHVSSTHVAYAAGNSFAVTIPAGTGNGIVVQIGREYPAANPGAISPPDGTWTQAEGSPLAGDGGGDNIEQSVWTKADAPSSQQTYTFTWATSCQRTGVGHRFAQAATSGTLFDAGTDHEHAASASTNAPATTITTAGPDRMLFWACLAYIGSAGWTPPTGFTELVDQQNISTATLPQATQGSSGSVGGSNAGSDRKLAFLGALKPASTGQDIAVGQAAETDTATAITRQKLRAVGQAAETDTAQPIRPAKLRAVGQAVATDTATQITRRKLRSVGLAVEVDTATRLSTGPQRVDVGQAQESDTATAVTRRKTRAIGQATEADSATTVGRQKVRGVNQAAETDTATQITRRKLKTVGLAAETDTAQPITGRKTRQLNQAAEADSATQITRRKARTVNQAAEADSATAITRRKLRPVGQAQETDTAGTITRPGAAKIIGQAVEVDSAQPIGKRKQRLLGQAAETDTATQTRAAHRASVGQAQETDSATALARSKRRTVNQAAETDSAQPMSRRKQRLLGQAVEVDTAAALVPKGIVRVIGQAVEVDVAFAIAAIKTLARILDAEGAQSVGEGPQGTITLDTEASGLSGASEGASGHASVAVEVTGTQTAGA